jgi:tripeptide aminopeptidase
MIDRNRLLETLLQLVRLPSLSGHEEQVAHALMARLSALGLTPERDAAGNVFAEMPGSGEPLILTAHMDTVAPCAAIHPLVAGGEIRSDGTSVLGADDKAGIAAILEAVTALREEGLPHRPLGLLFTVREEVGLEGAQAWDIRRFPAPLAVGLDAGGPQGTIVVSAPAQDSLQAEIHGRAAHAGVSPELGINAIRVAAEAILAMPLGRVDAETTANIGIISGGLATNIVPDLVTLRGEARSRNGDKLTAQTARMVAALEQASAAHGATATVHVKRKYEAFSLPESAPVVQLVSRAMRSLNITPLLVPTGGGSDANVFNRAGLPTVQISAGMAEVHTTHEHVSLGEIVSAAQIVLACATL